jgi:hypothetical protein
MASAQIPDRETIMSRNTGKPILKGLYCLSFLPEPTDADA